MQLHIVLVAPARPENVGAAARAMKTMGFTSLRIVDSEAHLQPAARWVAHGAGDILDGVQTFATLEQALADVDFTVATTARSRARFHYYCTPQQLLGQLSERSQWVDQAALVFADRRTYAGGLPFAQSRSGGDGVLLSTVRADERQCATRAGSQRGSTQGITSARRGITGGAGGQRRSKIARLAASTPWCSATAGHGDAAYFVARYRKKTDKVIPVNMANFAV